MMINITMNMTITMIIMIGTIDKSIKEEDEMVEECVMWPRSMGKLLLYLSLLKQMSKLLFILKLIFLQKKPIKYYAYTFSVY